MVDVRNNVYGNYVLYLLEASIGIFLVLYISQKISENKYLEKIGQSTMTILLFHKFPILFFQSVFPITKIYFHNLRSIQGTLCAIFVGAFTIVSCLILKMIFEWIEKKGKYSY